MGLFMAGGQNTLESLRPQWRILFLGILPLDINFFTNSNSVYNFCLWFEEVSHKKYFVDVTFDFNVGPFSLTSSSFDLKLTWQILILFSPQGTVYYLRIYFDLGLCHRQKHICLNITRGCECACRNWHKIKAVLHDNAGAF